MFSALINSDNEFCKCPEGLQIIKTGLPIPSEICHGDGQLHYYFPVSFRPEQALEPMLMAVD